MDDPSETRILFLHVDSSSLLEHVESFPLLEHSEWRPGVGWWDHGRPGWGVPPTIAGKVPVGRRVGGGPCGDGGVKIPRLSICDGDNGGQGATFSGSLSGTPFSLAAAIDRGSHKDCDTQTCRTPMKFHASHSFSRFWLTAFLLHLSGATDQASPPCSCFPQNCCRWLGQVLLSVLDDRAVTHSVSRAVRHGRRRRPRPPSPTR
jgi:hypothetical protein